MSVCPVAESCTPSAYAVTGKPNGHVGSPQHGFLAGELMIQFEGEEESDEND